jgi:phytoene synthase
MSQSAVAQENDSAGQRASGSSFYTAMRILPREQRLAMYEIYSFCRQVDDIADSDLPRDERHRRLAKWRDDIEAMYAKAPPRHLAILSSCVRQFSLEKQDFIDVIDGMEMDAKEDIRAPDMPTLDTYCDRVASGVGRLSVKVFGMSRDDGIALSHHLGRALQLTNILRDLDEDASIGRLYLPREALAAAGISTTDPKLAIASPNLTTACTMLVERARAHFAEADTIMQRSPRRAVRAPRIMYEVYRPILEGMAARGFAAPRERLRVSKSRLAYIVLRYAIV